MIIAACSWRKWAGRFFSLALFLSILLSISYFAQSVFAKESKSTHKKVLIVLTSHDRLGDTGKSTGYYLPELTHPFLALIDRGLDVDIASINGGKAPMDPKSKDLSDSENKRFLEDKVFSGKLDNTIALKDVDPGQYQAIVFAGGHGTMWDFPDNKDVQRIAPAIYEKGGVVAAVCHGPAALVNLKLSNGKYLVAGKKLTAFTNEEEEKVELAKVVPFLLETSLEERGASFEKSPPFKEKVVVSDRLVTGQNPASAQKLGTEIANLLSKQEIGKK